MKSAPSGLTLTETRRPHRGRRFAAAAMFMLGAAVAVAQNAVTTLAGTAGTAGNDDGTGSAARFRLGTVSGAAVDSSGNVYVADGANNVIRKITPAGVVTTFAGSTSGSSGFVNDVGTAARFSNPQGIAIDGSGTLFVADTGNNAIRVITIGGSVSTLAGSGNAGFTNAAGTSADFRAPSGVAVPSTGSATVVFVADTGNNVVRQITVSTGAVTTLAGSAIGVGGFTDGVDTAAQFSSPQAIVSDAVGTSLFVADTSNNAIRRIVIASGSATVTTFAGSNVGGYADGTGTDARFNAPRGIALDTVGNLVVADTGNHVIRTVSSSGGVSLLAGAPQTAGYTDSLATTAARFSSPAGVAVDGTRATYVVDSGNYVVRKISAAGAPTFSTQPANATITVGGNATFSVTVTGNPVPTYQWQRQRVGDAGFSDLAEGAPYTGTKTTTLTITGVSAAMNGDFLRLVATNSLGTATSDYGQLATTLGVVFSTYTTKFATPSGVVVSSTGVTYVADTNNHVIRAISTDGVVSVFAGAVGVIGSKDGFPTDARFNSPTALALDSTGNLYVADTGNDTIRKLLPNGYTTTVAGSPGQMGSTDGLGSAARFSVPSGVAVDSAGNFYVADTLNHTIRKIATDGTVSTYAGAAGVRGTTDGTTTNARFAYPQGVAVDAAGNVYVADTVNSTIRLIAGGNVSTLAGSAGTTGATDGNGGTARFNQPRGIFVADATTLYVADTGNQTLRKVTTAGDVTTIAGSPGVSGNADGDAATVRFNQPTAIAVDSSGNIAVADAQNNAVRRTGAFTAPTIQTQPVDTQAVAGQNATFTVVARGLPSPVYQWQRQATGTSGFVNLNNSGTYSGVNTATLTILGTTTAMTGDQFQVVVSNLVSPNATSSVATLNVRSPDVAPSITTQPANVAVNQGATANFSVTATGSGTLGYQWRKDGTSISGATSATLAIPSAQPSDAGLYTVVVSNGVGGVTSSAGSLTVNTAPVLSTPLRAQTVVTGGSITLVANVTGGGNMSYQWRKNGTAIAGATNATLTIANASATDAALYDFVATNSLGSVSSGAAQLAVNSAAAAPVITAQPQGKTVLVGTYVALNVGASAAPAATYQWRKNGTAISGATADTLPIGNVVAGDAADYDVVVSNSAGSVTSAVARVRVLAKSYRGVYFGTFANGLGSFALYVRNDNTGVFLGVIPTSSAALTNLGLSLNDSGQFSFIQPAGTLGATTVSGAIANDGSVSGTLAGGATSTLTGTKSADVGATQTLAGFYLAGALNSAGNTLTILSASGQAYVVAQVGATSDGGLGGVSSGGQVAVNTGKTAITEAVNVSNGTITSAVVGAVNGSFTGASESAISLQRLANISTRAKVSSGDSVAIAGFVINGTESKLVLIRAVGPTLGSTYGVAGALATPKLDLYRGTTLLASNTGISTSTNAAAIAAAGSQVGAFALGSGDSAILTTLPPGGYTAQVSGANGATGVALVEVYDLSPAAAGQKIVDISTRAPAASGENALIAGVVVSGSTPKRVLIRAIGPGLAPYGVTGLLAQPVLELKTPAGATIASNTIWSTSTDAAAITAATNQVGAFPLAAADSALIVTLAPGGYSAQVTGVAGSSGIALVEIYELQ